MKALRKKTVLRGFVFYDLQVNSFFYLRTINNKRHTLNSKKEIIEMPERKFTFMIKFIRYMSMLIGKFLHDDQTVNHASKLLPWGKLLSFFSLAIILLFVVMFKGLSVYNIGGILSCLILLYKVISAINK